jgi:hypothetical protein
MGIITVYSKPNLSRRLHMQYNRMRKGFIYLFAIFDWYS